MGYPINIAWLCGTSATLVTWRGDRRPTPTVTPTLLSITKRWLCNYSMYYMRFLKSYFKKEWNVSENLQPHSISSYTTWPIISQVPTWSPFCQFTLARFCTQWAVADGKSALLPPTSTAIGQLKPTTWRSVLQKNKMNPTDLETSFFQAEKKMAISVNGGLVNVSRNNLTTSCRDMH